MNAVNFTICSEPIRTCNVVIWSPLIYSIVRFRIWDVIYDPGDDIDVMSLLIQDELDEYL